jgi:hypothetical protein
VQQIRAQKTIRRTRETMADGAGSRYRFGPLERRGFLAGWRGGQAAVVAAGLIVGVGALRALPTAVGLLVAVVAVGLSLAAATWPFAGRTGDEWVPDVARHAATVARGRTWRAPRKPTGGPAAPGRARKGAKAQGVHPPRRGPFSALRILQVEAGHGDAAVRVSEPTAGGPRAPSALAAVIYDPGERTYTAVLPASGPGFVLLAGAERDRRVSGWAAALGALARQGTPVHRIQWVARTLPGSAPGQSTDAGASGMQPDAGGPTGASASYHELLAVTRSQICRNQVLLAMSVKAARPGLALRPPGAQDHATSCALLLRELAAFRRRLSDADVDTAPALAPRALASVMRAGFSSSRWAWPEECGTTWPWPVAGEVLWDAVRMDGTWHATYWVAEWPRTDVGADFLGPLLLASDVRQTVSVTMEPLSPLDAAREAQQARTADVADAELRRRGGFLHTARRRREEETVADREVELADGHAPFKFSGYVTATADTREELDASCGRIEQSAGQCGMELRRCFGDQQRAFSFTLPLCRGLE